MKRESADELHLRNSMAVVSFINILEFLSYDIDPKEKKNVVQSKTYSFCCCYLIVCSFLDQALVKLYSLFIVPWHPL